MLVTDDSIVTDSKPGASRKALLPMLVTDDSIVTDSKPGALQKAYDPMLVTFPPSVRCCTLLADADKYVGRKGV